MSDSKEDAGHLYLGYVEAFVRRLGFAETLELTS
jgi:hypothetical protein